MELSSCKRSQPLRQSPRSPTAQPVAPLWGEAAAAAAVAEAEAEGVEGTGRGGGHEIIGILSRQILCISSFN